MTLINFHTHRPAASPCERVVQDGIDTWGIHPWHATEASPETVPPANILAVGECGLDSLCPTPMDVQMKAFRRCIAISEERGVPLFLHCVRQMELCLTLRRKMNCTQPWIWHGFRGNARRLQRLVSEGFYISFGFHYVPEAVLACPLDRLLLETDDDPRPITELYAQISALLGMETTKLARRMQANFDALFPQSFEERKTPFAV